MFRSNTWGYYHQPRPALCLSLSRGVLLELLLLDRLSLRDRDFLIFPIFPLLLLPPTGPLALVFAPPLPPDDAPISPVLPPPVRRILAPALLTKGNQENFRCLYRASGN